MSKEEYLIKVNNNISDSNTQEINQDLNTSPSKENQQNEQLLIQEKNQSIAYKKKIPKKEFEEGIRPTAYSSTQKNKSRYPEEKKEISEFTTNKK